MTRLSAFVRENGLTLLVVAVLAVAYMALRSNPTELASAQEFTDSLALGEPTIVYFYSNT